MLKNGIAKQTFKVHFGMGVYVGNYETWMLGKVESIVGNNSCSIRVTSRR